MAQAGGSTTQSGILFQNSVAALYLGRLCDSGRRGPRDRVFQVDVETVDAVDDIVVTFVDYHRAFIQAKEALRQGSKEWDRLWNAFDTQFHSDAFTRGRDHLVLHLGKYTRFAEPLAEVCDKARSVGPAYDTWRERLSKEQMMLVERIAPALKKCGEESEIVAFFAAIRVEVWPSDTIERDHVPRWMPQSNIPEMTLFSLLRDRVGGRARVKGKFTRVELIHELETQNNIRIREHAVVTIASSNPEAATSVGSTKGHVLAESRVIPARETGSTTFLDHTTLFGAARALDVEGVRRSGLPLTNLLSLSQLVEAIVLHDNLQCESGSTPTWEPYLEALRDSAVGRLLESHEFPVQRATGQCDTSESDIADAISWSIGVVERPRMLPLLWAARVRRAALGTIDGMLGRRNATLDRYIEIARSFQGTDFDLRLSRVEQKLVGNGIEPEAWLVLIRGKLLQQWAVERGHHYFPHYSRQPLLLTGEDQRLPLQRWNMEKLGQVRSEQLRLNGSLPTGDQLDDVLSPVFLACLKRSKAPIDILTEACLLRMEKGAISFRKEMALTLSAADDYGAQARYKTRARERLRDLRHDLADLLEVGPADEAPTTSSLPHPFNWTRGWMRGTFASRSAVDTGVTFLANLLSRSLSVWRAARELERIFGVSCQYDIDLLASGAPKQVSTL